MAKLQLWAEIFLAVCANPINYINDFIMTIFRSRSFFICLLVTDVLLVFEDVFFYRFLKIYLVIVNRNRLFSDNEKQWQDGKNFQINGGCKKLKNTPKSKTVALYIKRNYQNYPSLNMFFLNGNNDAFATEIAFF